MRRTRSRGRLPPAAARGCEMRARRQRTYSLSAMADQIDPQTVPRGRHAPPLEVRLTVQRRRLYEAAAAVFARVGYADASAEAISREAGMSKATFYEHFANKEECLLALFDEAATEVMRALAGAATDEDVSYEERIRTNVGSFL